MKSYCHNVFERVCLSKYWKEIPLHLPCNVDIIKYFYKNIVCFEETDFAVQITKIITHVITQTLCRFLTTFIFLRRSSLSENLKTNSCITGCYRMSRCNYRQLQTCINPGFGCVP